mmetsp:Transcript_21345/g.42824  ORF Transcript_21345/g.42824 Transcript_21345/m.42824 type:complete len:241 (+) Transcript_21345:374-1096(+)
MAIEYVPRILHVVENVFRRAAEFRVVRHVGIVRVEISAKHHQVIRRGGLCHLVAQTLELPHSTLAFRPDHLGWPTKCATAEMHVVNDEVSAKPIGGSSGGVRRRRRQGDFHDTVIVVPPLVYELGGYNGPAAHYHQASFRVHCFLRLLVERGVLLAPDVLAMRCYRQDAVNDGGRGFLEADYVGGSALYDSLGDGRQPVAEVQFRICRTQHVVADYHQRLFPTPTAPPPTKPEGCRGGDQ